MRRHVFSSILLSVVLLFVSGQVLSQSLLQSANRVVTCRVPAPSLAGNLLGDSTIRPITIYLPQSYFSTQNQYPVVYFLTGFGDAANDIQSGRCGFLLPETMDSVVSVDSVREMILVVISGCNILGGSFFGNSPVIGNWEGFVANDVVSYVDSHFRTIAVPASRGLAGHSMGGHGALHIAMHCPDTFGALYLMSAPVVDTVGMRKTPLLASSVLIDTIVQIRERLQAMKRDAAKSELLSLLKRSDWTVSLTFAYGAAFLPDTSGQFPFIGYPYHRENGQIVADSLLLRKWECGFGAVPMKLWKYRDNLAKLSRIGIECGLSDEFPWIREGCGYLSIQLDLEEIPHKTSFFRGGHQDKLGQRLREAMLPFFSEALAFQS